MERAEWEDLAMTSTKPGRSLWIFLALLLSGFAVAPSNPGKALIEPGKGMFLIAGRDLLDPNFAQSVVLLVDVDDYGVLGLVINRATQHNLAEVIPALQDDATAGDVLSLGGPVLTDTVSLLMRIEKPDQDIHHVVDDVYFSTSLPLLESAIKKPDHEQRLRVYAGHSGWGPGQLQDELKRGDWYLVGADAELVFNTGPDSIWPLLIRSVSGLWVQNGARQWPDYDTRIR